MKIATRIPKRRFLRLHLLLYRIVRNIIRTCDVESALGVAVPGCRAAPRACANCHAAPEAASIGSAFRAHVSRQLSREERHLPYQCSVLGGYSRLTLKP